MYYIMKLSNVAATLISPGLISAHLPLSTCPRAWPPGRIDCQSAAGEPCSFAFQSPTHIQGRPTSLLFFGHAIVGFLPQWCSMHILHDWMVRQIKPVSPSWLGGFYPSVTKCTSLHLTLEASSVNLQTSRLQ